MPWKSAAGPLIASPSSHLPRRWSILSAIVLIETLYSLGDPHRRPSVQTSLSFKSGKGSHSRKRVANARGRSRMRLRDHRNVPALRCLGRVFHPHQACRRRSSASMGRRGPSRVWRRVPVDRAQGRQAQAASSSATAAAPIVVALQQRHSLLPLPMGRAHRSFEYRRDHECHHSYLGAAARASWSAGVSGHMAHQPRRCAWISGRARRGLRPHRCDHERFLANGYLLGVILIVWPASATARVQFLPSAGFRASSQS